VAFGQFELPALGLYNVRNATAALAVGAAAGLDAVALAEGLKRFQGVRRRLEHRGQAGGVDVYDDFAHHPTAIAETLAGIRSAYPDRRLWAVFEPRSATSCRRVFHDDFVRAFGEGRADEVLVAAVYRSALPEADRLSPAKLVSDLEDAGVRARHIPAVADIVATLADETRPGDLVVVMSNGGFDDIHRKLLTALAGKA